MSTISLESSIRTCKVDSGWANKIQSDRFENPALMVCPVWNGVDMFGRYVCPDSFDTKTAGCNSPDDRVEVENALRPQYIEYVNLDADGIRGDIYTGVGGKFYNANDMRYEEAGLRTKVVNDIYKIAGNAGYEYGANIYPKCRSYKYDDAQASIAQAQANRYKQFTRESYLAHNAARRSGMGFKQTF